MPVDLLTQPKDLLAETRQPIDLLDKTAPKRDFLDSLINAGLDVAKDVPSQIQDLMNIPAALLGTPRPAMRSKLATEAIPYLLEKITTPIGTITIPPLTTRNIKSIFTGKGITETAEIEPSVLAIGWYGLMGASLARNQLALARWNSQLNKLIKTEEVRGAVMNNMPAFENLMTQVGVKMEGMDLTAKTNFILSQAKSSPKLGSAIMDLVSGRIAPKAPIVGQPIETGVVTPTIVPKAPIVAPKQPITAPIAPKAIPEGLPLAIRLKSGEIITDATAKLHSDIITAKGISPDDVMDVGIEVKGEYQATKLPDEIGGAPLEGLPKVPEEAMEKAKGLIPDKKQAVFQFLKDHYKNPDIYDSLKDAVEINLGEALTPEEQNKVLVFIKKVKTVEDSGTITTMFHLAPKQYDQFKNQVEFIARKGADLIFPEVPKEVLEKAKQIITKADIPPEEPPKFPGVSEEFLKQPKKKTTILQYFTPAEYHLKELGFDAKIGQPVREALQDFSIELMQKNEKLLNIQKEHYSQIPKKAIRSSNEKLWQYMDKDIPEKDIDTVEAKIAQKLRPETEEMLKRINEVNKLIGREEVKGVKNYILHMLKPELLNEIYAKGVLPPELAKVMEYIPNKNIFLRTAQQRKGIPDEWLTKNPYELMRAMYAIDLRYVYLQKALYDIDPYVKAVKEYKGEEGDYWSPETYKYLDDWVKQAIKMRPSNWDVLIDNMLEYSIAPLLRKAGLKVSHMPWRDFVNTMSAAAHTGALGMRVRPILRNLVQSTFDWVMYGTQPYLKGSAKFMTLEGQNILKQSKVWKTRMPFEAQDLATLRKIFKVGSLGYRWSDLHNVGKGLLTRYYHAVDNLGKTHEQALAWADLDLPATQWSYRREDLPRAYWTTTGRAFWTLGSWWMNFYTRFLPELSRRAFTGQDVLGRKVPVSERLGIMRLLVLIGALFAIREKSKELTGTVIDYTGQIKPTPLREAPIAQLGKSLTKISQGITDENERTRKEGMRELANTAKIFIPWELAAEDLWKLLNGEKELGEFLFYQKKEKKKKKVKF